MLNFNAQSIELVQNENEKKSHWVRLQPLILLHYHNISIFSFHSLFLFLSPFRVLFAIQLVFIHIKSKAENAPINELTLKRLFCIFANKFRAVIFSRNFHNFCLICVWCKNWIWNKKREIERDIHVFGAVRKHCKWRIGISFILLMKL